MISPILARKKITNRQERRLFENESRRISDLMLFIPLDFLKDIFSESDEDYELLYLKYNELWQKYCESAKQLHPRLKICDPNPHFFEVTFKPLEKPLEDVFYKLNKFLRCDTER